MDPATVAVYEARADEWNAARGPGPVDTPCELAAGLGDGWRADLGCGPGWHVEHLGAPVLALDASLEMLRAARRRTTAAPVAGDLEALPLRSGVLAGAWAAKSYLHLRRQRLPLALADLHRALLPEARIGLRLLAGTFEGRGSDDFAGRYFAAWQEGDLVEVLEGAGFTIDRIGRRTNGHDWIDVLARRRFTLPDFVGDGMRMLLVGLNPSPYAADVGVGFARPGNRFWPAALRAGIVSRDRDPVHALIAHGVGMTDLVKRVTRRAAELDTTEYEEGAQRIARIVAWLEPSTVCFVGLSGFRAAFDRHATAGWQSHDVGGRPVYVMPNPSGLNAHTNVDDLAEHLARASQGRGDAP